MSKLPYQLNRETGSTPYAGNVGNFKPLTRTDNSCVQAEALTQAREHLAHLYFDVVRSEVPTGNLLWQVYGMRSAEHANCLR
jgi:hypothetical protein